jgi:hypothetical protein
MPVWPAFNSGARFEISISGSDRNEWVYDTMGQFLDIEKYNFNRPNIVSFISVD